MRWKHQEHDLPIRNELLLTERETARRLAVSPACLRYWRSHRRGPPWVRIGERLIRYHAEGLRKWIEERANGGK